MTVEVGKTSVVKYTLECEPPDKFHSLILPTASFSRLLIAAVLFFHVSLARAGEPAALWPTITLVPPREVTLSGPLGESLGRGVARLAQPPYTEPWLRADVSFEVERVFTNYSGDVSGRFLELASLTSPGGHLSPPTLASLMKTVAGFQKPDGHFGTAVDLSKPLPWNAPPIPILWGNARLLVGLLTAAQEFHDDRLLAAARRLGDFYVNTAGQLCSPAREADYRSSGTDGGSYTCCYFPAIEGLTMLYRATKDDRYLKQAERMAEFFAKFDCLPNNHSHGNLCAWRGILELYEITGKRTYLDRAKAKWESAMKGGFVWPLGGVGEQWRLFFAHDEGCSESDWLRLNLDLWRLTGETRYLDLAERLVENQYVANQCPNGGYGVAHFEGDSAGPVAIIGETDECPYCCSFHAPLGLHFLKGYLAAGCQRGVIVNFPYNFTAPIKAAGQEWSVTVRSKPEHLRGRTSMEIELTPRRQAAARGTLLVRMPGWASAARVVAASGGPVAAPTEGGYLRIERDFKAGERLAVEFRGELAFEGRRFQKASLTPRLFHLKDVAVLAGPQLLFAMPVKGTGRPLLLATRDADGQLSFPTGDNGQFVTVALSGLNASDAQIAETVRSAPLVFLRPWPAVTASCRDDPASAMGDRRKNGNVQPRRLPFMFDLVVVPASSLSPDLAKLAARARAQ